MLKIGFKLGLFSLFLLFACTTNEGKKINEDKKIVFDDNLMDFIPLNLTPFEIPAQIMLPDETVKIGAVTIPEVEHQENDFKWKIKLGQQFQLLIEDYGNRNDLVAKMRNQLNNQHIFNVRYLLNEKDMIVFEKTLNVKGIQSSSSKLGQLHRSYYVYGQKKIGEVNYELQCDQDGVKKELIVLLVKSIKSFDALNHSSNRTIK